MNNFYIETCDICLNAKEFCLCVICENCKYKTKFPFIECTKCDNLFLCLSCFAMGVEFNSHESDHNYRIIRYDIELFKGSGWSMEEEIKMLNILNEYGYGNWELLAEKLNRSVNDVKQHYNTMYIDCPKSFGLPSIRETKESVFPQPVVPYTFITSNTEEPPRFAPDSLGYDLLAGYNAARSDFECQYNVNAEQILGCLCQIEIDTTLPSNHILGELQYALMMSYNRHLVERNRRKEIIGEHGLLLLRKTYSWLHRYTKSLTRNRIERLMVFMQFFTGFKFDLFIENLHRATELKRRIAVLNNYRKQGITTLAGAEVYDSINKVQEQHNKDIQAFKSHPFLQLNRLKKDSMLLMPRDSLPGNRRAESKPLDIIGLPAFEKLSKEERELCSRIRLVPQIFLELKESLINENKKFGYLSLKTARKMLKIDVNKTRKLYDFLIAEGFISKPPT